MRILAGASIILFASVALAAAPEGKRVDGEHVHATMPAGWKPLPEAANAVKNGMLGETTELVGDAVAYGDARAGVFGVLAWIATKQPVGRVRPEIEGFVGGVRESLEAADQKVTRWDVKDTPTRRTVHLGATTADADLSGVVAAVVDGRGILHGYVVTCTRAGDAKGRRADQAAARCDALLASFELTWQDAELKKLEKK